MTRFLLISLTFFCFIPIFFENLGAHASPKNQRNIGNFLESEENHDNWQKLKWKMPEENFVKLFKNHEIKKYPEFEIGECYFSNAILVDLELEKWEAWLCKDRKNGRITRIAFEKGFNGVFFDIENSKSKMFFSVLTKLKKIYGPADLIWKECHNSRWNHTEKYTWLHKSMNVSLIHRDLALNHFAVHFYPSKNTNNHGPGICATPPIKLKSNKN